MRRLRIGYGRNILEAASGSLLHSGSGASLRRGHSVPAAAGSYAVAGRDAGKRHVHRMPAAAGSFAFSGRDAALFEQSTGVSPVGGNVSPPQYFMPTPVFTDILYQGFGLVEIAAQDVPVAVGDDGWPVKDFVAITQFLPPLTPQTDIQVEVTGDGTPSLPTTTGATLLSAGTYNAATNTRIITIRLSANRPFANIKLQLVNTRRTAASAVGTGVSNIVFCRPGYTLAQVKAQRFTNEFIAFATPFSTLRFMDWQQVNGVVGIEQGLDFAKRPTRNRRRTTYSYSEDPTGLTAKRLGVCLEDIVELCNIVGADPWLCMPFNATNSYVAQVATFMANNLSSGLKPIFEWVNELWNSGAGFEQFAKLLDLVSTELNGFSDISNRGGHLERFLVSATRSAGAVTLTFSQNHTYSNGQTVHLTNFDGVTATNPFVVTTTGLAANQIRVTKAGADGAVPTTTGFACVDGNTTSNLVGQGFAMYTFQAMPRYAIRRIKEYSDAIRAVVGNAAMMTRFRPVFAWQSISGDFFAYLNWLDLRYGVAAGGRGVSGYIRALAHAPYYFLNGIPVGLPDIRTDTSAALTVQDYVDTLAATCAFAKVQYGFGLKGVVAKRYGIESWCYEGGPDTAQNSGATNNIKKSQAQIHPGMRQPLKDMVEDHMRLGTDDPVYCHYFVGEGDPNSAATTDRFWSNQSITALTDPKYAALSELAGAVVPIPARNIGLGTHDARLRETKYIDIVPDLLTTAPWPNFSQADVSSSRGTLDYLWYETSPTPQTRTITLRYACRFANRSATVRINGTVVGTAGFVNSGSLAVVADTAAFTFTSRPGSNGIELERNASQGVDVELRALIIG